LFLFSSFFFSVFFLLCSCKWYMNLSTSRMTKPVK
jgi:hypothetical protein